MKKLNLLMMTLAIAGLGFLATSCNPTESDPPTITVTPTADTVEAIAGDTVTFTAVLGTNNTELSKLKIEVTKGSASFGTTDSTLTKGKTSLTINVKIPVPADVNVGDVLKVVITVTDAEPLSASATKYIKVKAAEALVNSFTNIKLNPADASGGWTNNCASVDGSKFTYAQAVSNTALQAKCDIVYHYTTKTLIYAPSAVTSVFGNNAYSGWTTKNATKFYTTTLTAANFNAITADSDKPIKDAITGTHTDKVEGVAVGDVIGFETVGGKKGLIKVVEIKAGYTATDYIVIDIKVQK